MCSNALIPGYWDCTAFLYNGGLSAPTHNEVHKFRAELYTLLSNCFRSAVISTSDLSDSNVPPSTPFLYTLILSSTLGWETNSLVGLGLKYKCVGFEWGWSDSAVSEICGFQYLYFGLFILTVSQLWMMLGVQKNSGLSIRWLVFWRTEIPESDKCEALLH